MPRSLLSVYQSRMSAFHCLNSAALIGGKSLTDSVASSHSGALGFGLSLCDSTSPTSKRSLTMSIVSSTRVLMRHGRRCSTFRARKGISGTSASSMTRGRPRMQQGASRRMAAVWYPPSFGVTQSFGGSTHGNIMGIMPLICPFTEVSISLTTSLSTIHRFDFLPSRNSWMSTSPSSLAM